MAFATDGALAGGLEDSFKGIFNALSPTQARASAAASEPASSPVRPPAAPQDAIVRNPISTSTDAYDFKGDALGMTLDAFRQAHHSPGTSVVQNQCEGTKCKLATVWKPDYKCDADSNRVSTCSRSVRLLDDLSGNASYFFLDGKLAYIYVTFINRNGKFEQAIDALNSKFGTFSMQTSSRNYGSLTHWEDQTSVVELSQHQCLDSADPSDPLMSLQVGIASAINGKICTSSISYGVSTMVFVDKGHAQAAMDAIVEAKSKAVSKAKANI